MQSNYSVNNPNTIYRRKRAAEYLGLSVATLHRLVQRGELPPPIRLSVQASGWRLADLDAFISRKAAA